jgi:predicted metal-dependent phosphoesterase TrpH
MKKYQSLHSHTTNSDGLLSHKELIEISKKYNIDTLAFTDHDSVISKDQVDSIKDVKDFRWVSGIEISSGWPLDLGGGSSSSFHIVGLFVDYNDTKLKNYCKKAQEGRIERMNRMIVNLNRIGIKVTSKECLDESNGEAVARPHIVSALLKHEENRKRIEEIKKEMEEDKSFSEAYNKLEQTPYEQLPYDLFLTEDSYINDVYVDYLYYLDMDSSVKLIRDSGGVAILAHYFTCLNKVTPELLDTYIKDKRLDGIETVFGIHELGTSRSEEVNRAVKIVKDITNKYKCIESGGADIHSEKDIDMFYNNKEYADSTKYLLDNILLEDNKINIKFSNIDNG